ncbi:MAG: alginate export family protein, partial [Planctomycetes bacterium]|nr:alginate export family protein [Planctomycetota bacterium]
MDLFLQLKLTPLPKLGIEIAFHQFWLHERKDLRYFGTGAFTRSALGLGGSSSDGSNNIGQEIDAILSYRVHRAVTVLLGYSRLF